MWWILNLFVIPIYLAGLAALVTLTTRGALPDPLLAFALWLSAAFLWYWLAPKHHRDTYNNRSIVLACFIATWLAYIYARLTGAIPL